jgi:hypothetical protein
MKTIRRLTVGDIGFQVGSSIFLISGLVLFYAYSYPVHPDLAGSALTGRLAVTLGDAFGNYSVYFPPAEKAWFSIAARLSDLTGVRVDIAVVMMSGAMVMFGTGLAYHIRRIAVGASPLFLIVPAIVLVVVPVLFKNSFGLREHLVVAGLWPYLVLRVSDPSGTLIGPRLRAVVGLWVGATLLFKYVYSVVVLLVELADAWLARRASLLFRIENIVAGAAVFLYLFFWLGIDPAQRAAISAMLRSIEGHLLSPQEGLTYFVSNLLLAVLLLLASRVCHVPIRVTMLAFAAVVGAAAAAWWQQRWYAHHLLPITMAYFAWWWMAAGQLRWWCHGMLALNLSLSVSSQFSESRAFINQFYELDEALHAGGQSVAGKRVAIINAHPSPYNDYLITHDALRWNPMMNIAYAGAELKPFDTRENAGRLAPPVTLDDPGRRILHDQMLRLWSDMPPDAILIDRAESSPLQYARIDWIHAFSGDPAFAAILSRYRPVQVYDGKWIKFTYYVRAD